MCRTCRPIRSAATAISFRLIMLGHACTSPGAGQAASPPARTGSHCCPCRSTRAAPAGGEPGCCWSDRLAPASPICVLRLLARGFDLVSDDQTEVEDGIARPVAALAGLLEVRGLGIVRLTHAGSARLALVAQMGQPSLRMPSPTRNECLGLPMVMIDPLAASAPERVALALDCALGQVSQLAGAFAA